MIKTIYHVVSLLGTAQRLLLSLYMEEMKNHTLHADELGPLDFLPPELLEILEARARSRMVADAAANAFPLRKGPAPHLFLHPPPTPRPPPPLPDWVKATPAPQPPLPQDPPPALSPSVPPSSHPATPPPPPAKALPPSSPSPEPPDPPQPLKQAEPDIPVFLIEDLPTLTAEEPTVIPGADPPRPLPSAVSGLLYPPSSDSEAEKAGLGTLRELLEARSTLAVTPPVFQLPEWTEGERQTWTATDEDAKQPDLPEWEGSGEGCGVSGCAHNVNVYLSPGEEAGRGRGAPAVLPGSPPDAPPNSHPDLPHPDRACTGNKVCQKVPKALSFWSSAEGREVRLQGYKCVAGNCVLQVACPKHVKFGPGPPRKCDPPTDPFKLPKSPIESWFTKDVFYDLFPKANIGHGPDECSPYSYEAFIIAASQKLSAAPVTGFNSKMVWIEGDTWGELAFWRYFPEFGGENPDNGYSKRENARRDLAAFFAHAVQETGENDASLYSTLKKKEEADACFYRGGFFNWFEGGPRSLFLPKDKPGFGATDGDLCIAAGRYCASGGELDYWFPCNTDTNSTDDDGKRQKRANDELFKGCYFGRGAIQISYNYNYGQFQRWLNQHRINVDLLNNPNLVMTKRDPPLAVLASLWFYMTPQPPKPSMHDIVLGTWEPGEANREAGYFGPIFGPTSLVINNECGGEDPEDPGGPGESRRIKAFKWFSDYFNVPVEKAELLTCKGMPKLLDGIPHPLSWQPDWSNTWKDQPCDCAPANYGGMIPYFASGHYPERWEKENLKNRIRCIYSIYDNPGMYGMEESSSACLKHPIPHNLRKQFSSDAANEYLVSKP